jgi:deoxyuridine 5'-triphosphate nucleotidohydrolase
MRTRNTAPAAAYLRRDPRDERIPISCEAGTSEGCKRSYQVSIRAEAKNRGHNGGRFICLPCSRYEKNSGRQNPNARHLSLDDGCFSKVDTEGKAYLLGWIASDGSITRGTIALFVHRKDSAILRQWNQIIGAELPTRSLRNLVGISINSQQIVSDVCRWLGARPGKKSAAVGFPALASDELTWAFLRGFFDGVGSVFAPTQERGPRCNLTTGSEVFREAVRAWCPIKASYSGDQIEWGGNNALDFLGRLYDDATFALPRKRDLYRDWCNWVPSLGGPKHQGRGVSFRWVRADRDARPPRKTRVSDSGYDLTLLRKVKTNGVVDMFDTGIKVQPDFGWYFDVVARSSLTKTGYILANAVGVIDRTYTGTILIPLIKIDPTAPDLALPATVVQMIPRPIVHAEIIEVEALDDTDRGAGGFGSTGR